MGAVTDYIRQLQGYEEYGFSWEELKAKTGAPESSLRKELVRLAERRDVLPLRRGFYLIIPPRYLNLRKLPLSLYVEKLFRYLGKPYYVALYSAAALHGAAHQQVQQDYVITEPPALRDISRGAVRIRFFKATHWPAKNIVQKKSDAGLFNVSSPALTAVDLIHYQTKIGGLNRLLANLEELIAEIQPADVENLLSWYPYKSTLQRLGFLLDALHAGATLTGPVFRHLADGPFYPVLLCPAPQGKAGSTNNRWKVDVNQDIESDLSGTLNIPNE